jgi:HEAT repeat protein
MVRQQDLHKWRAGLHATFPLIGDLRRKWALDALVEHQEDPRVVLLLIEALDFSDEAVRSRASQALANLSSRAAIDALCDRWSKHRDKRLGQIVTQSKYVASSPAALRVLSGLKCGALDLLRQSDAASIAPLVAALQDSDSGIRENAMAVLRGLKNADGVDGLCARWLKDRDEQLGQIVTQSKYVASSPAALRVLSGLKCGALDLLRQSDAASIAPLVAALQDSDSGIRENAMAVLRRLENAEAIDALCARWAQDRDERLGQIIVEQGYLANRPIQLKVLTALKCGKRIAVERNDVVGYLVGLLGDPDETVRDGTHRSLLRVESGPALDVLCDQAIRNPAGPAAKLCLASGKRPRDHERLCLFLFVTRQLDEYFQEDFEFQNLRLEYERADVKVQSHVMDVVRSGDRRCGGFFGTRSKPLRECTEAEIKLAMDSWQRHQDWERLFQACLELPLKFSLSAFATLGQANWEPEAADLRSMHRQILADLGNEKPPAPKPPSAASSLFELWLEQGSRGKLAGLNEGQLCQRLSSAAPPDAVAIVAALAARPRPSDAAVRAVSSSPHWLVRLAGHVTGLLQDITRDEVQDANYWIGELASVKGVWELWPQRDPPGDLERLNAAPAEAWTGRLGGARKILRTILAHHNVAIRVEDFMVRPDEYDVVVEDAE